MQHRQTSRRRRPSSSNPRSMGQVAGNQSTGRLDVRVRGNAHQLLEKYKQMARDSQQAGDRVASEFYLQHADHYFRVLNDNRIRQEEQRARRNGAQRDEDTEADDQDRADEAEERPRRRASGRRSERSRENPRDSERTRARRDESTDEDAEVLQLDMSDGEAALAAFGGAPESATADVSAEEVESAEEAPKPRRRTRTRKPVDAAPDEG